VSTGVREGRLRGRRPAPPTTPGHPFRVFPVGMSRITLQALASGARTITSQVTLMNAPIDDDIRPIARAGTRCRLAPDPSEQEALHPWLPGSGCSWVAAGPFAIPSDTPGGWRGQPREFALAAWTVSQ
jgi:hypothetical protein